MKIVGIQKLTLLDYPGKMACTVFLDGCNFRCPYCHNSQLLDSPEAIMTVEELLAFLRKRRGLLEAVCITGGEPTLHPELPELLRSIRALGYAMKLDTNGYRPRVLEAVLREGLADYVAMDLKNGPGAYSATVGLRETNLAAIEESIHLLRTLAPDYELRTTVVTGLHDEDTMADMARWLLSITGEKGVKRLYLQPFVDRDTVPFGGFSAPDTAQLERFQRLLEPFAEELGIRGT